MSSSTEEPRFIKFHSISDMSASYYLSGVKERIEKLVVDKTINNLVDALEVHNACLYIENGLFLKEWTKEEIDTLKSSCIKIRKLIADFFNKSDPINLINNISLVPYDFIEDFFHQLQRFKIYDSLDESDFVDNVNEISIRYLLCVRHIVEKYGSYLVGRILADPKNIELLLAEHIEGNGSFKKAITFPADLSESDIEELLRKYIDSPEANLNYLRLIPNLEKVINCRVKDELKVLATRRSNSLEEEYRSTSKVAESSFSYSIAIHDLPDGEVLEEKIGNSGVEKKFSESWLVENLDYATILNNFIYLFKFVNHSGITTLFNKKSEISALEGDFGLTGEDDYETGGVFDFKSTLSLFELAMYVRFLEKNEIRLEAVLEWFFKEYLDSEFSVPNFIVDLPSEATTFKEKCRLIGSEMESVLKQFSLYVEEGHIDHEFINLSSDQTRFSGAPSLLQDKYVYANSDSNKMSSFLHLLFSDQTGLAYIEGITTQQNTLFDLLTFEKIKYDSFPEHSKSRIDFLLSENILGLDEDGVVVFQDEAVNIILFRLYKCEAIIFARCSQQMKNSVQEMIDRDLLESGTTLLSKQEASYFNYYLNKSEFLNGPNLRNAYLHGKYANLEPNDPKHEENYLILLRLFILLVIKINDDLCLKHGSQN